ncbi:hypothetical protein [Methylobacterium segetis]|uniref:hypothetical protein n=1 Tax=Methylobacterium segetis TaxID=2488750 RepID=UPI0010464CD6|nr:hypothetical protein [Methylobacterium segetis]
MLWLFMTTTGGLTSGSADFPSKDACEAARMEMGKMTLAIDEKSDAGQRPMIANPVEIRCIQKATGKP